MRFSKSLFGLVLIAGLLLVTIGPARARHFSNSYIRPPEGYSAGDFHVIVHATGPLIEYRLGGFSTLTQTWNAANTEGELTWAGGRVSSSQAPTGFCVYTDGNHGIYRQRVWFSDLQPEGNSPANGGESALDPGSPPLDEVPAISWLYDYSTDGVTDVYSVTFAHTASPIFSLHLEDLSVGYISSPIGLDQVSDEGFDAAGVTWVYKKPELFLAPGEFINFDVAIAAGAAVVHRVQLTFVGQDPLANPSIQAGQAFEP